MLVRQPNGKLCMCDWNGKIQKMNMTEEDYIEHCANQAREYIYNDNNIDAFGKLIERENVTDKELKEMGSEKTFDELIKYVPISPTDKQYISIDFETRGKCPTCGGHVVDGIGRTDDQCSCCGQILKWV